jgi:aspartate/glutamate racemase
MKQPPVYTGTIGVLAGAGPFAGVRTLERILAKAVDEGATSDEHFPQVLCWSTPMLGIAVDGRIEAGPGTLTAALDSLGGAGADVIGIACNSAHRMLAHQKRPGQVIDLIDELATAAAATGATRVGLLAASGALDSKLHATAFTKAGLTVTVPDRAGQQAVDAAIAGAVASGRSGDLTPVARTLDVELVVLGCTELDAGCCNGVACLDSVDVLAEALLDAVRP